MMQDTHARYGTVTRFFHWLIAALVINQFLRLSNHLVEGREKHWLSEMAFNHGSIGAVILILTVLRLLWSLKQENRPINDGLLGVIASISHKVMYFCLLALPILGALYVVGRGYPVKVFGWEVIAKPASDVEWALTLGHLHSPVAIFLAILVVIHILAALYHQFIRKDGLLKRII